MEMVVLPKVKQNDIVLHAILRFVVHAINVLFINRFTLSFMRYISSS